MKIGTRREVKKVLEGQKDTANGVDMVQKSIEKRRVSCHMRLV